MKRVGNLYERIISIENLELADKKAQKGKKKQKQVKKHNRNREQNIIELYEILKAKLYKTSEYYNFIIFEPKRREISRLPYFPDRIVHHAIMNYLEGIFQPSFINQTYSCIKKRGIHKGLKDVNKALKDEKGTIYCLKLDIKKFYPSVNKDILKSKLRHKIKDEDLLSLLSEIIDSYPKGLPLGNYLSQWFGNYYLTSFDHWLKEVKTVKYYFRYCDDIVILHHSKEFLHKLRKEIQSYLLKIDLRLSNYQVFPVESRGINFLGYISFHRYILIRGSIKKKFLKMLKKRRNNKSISSYMGWFVHANCLYLVEKSLFKIKT